MSMRSHLHTLIAAAVCVCAPPLWADALHADTHTPARVQLTSSLSSEPLTAAFTLRARSASLAGVVHDAIEPGVSPASVARAEHIRHDAAGWSGLRLSGGLATTRTRIDVRAPGRPVALGHSRDVAARATSLGPVPLAVLDQELARLREHVVQVHATPAVSLASGARL
jgi:hypothetical protein